MRSLVSVVMPVYNGERFIGQAVDSILGQSFRDFELIVVDDASKDRTAEILESHKAKDSRVRVHRLASNRGSIGARNAGMDLTKGQFIAAMDADDISLPHRLETQLAFLQERQDIGVVGAYVRLTDEHDHDGQLRTCPTPPGLTCWSFLFLNSMFHPTVMMRRTVFEKIGGYADGWKGGSEDFEFFSRASRHVRLANIPEALVRYRRWGGNMTSNQWEAQEEGADTIVMKAVSHFTQTDCRVETARALRGLATGNYPTTVEDIRTLADLLPGLCAGFLRLSPVLPADHREIKRDAAIKMWLLAALATRRSPALAARIGAAATRLYPASLPAFVRKAASRLTAKRR